MLELLTLSWSHSLPTYAVVLLIVAALVAGLVFLGGYIFLRQFLGDPDAQIADREDKWP